MFTGTEITLFSLSANKATCMLWPVKIVGVVRKMNSVMTNVSNLPGESRTFTIERTTSERWCIVEVKITAIYKNVALLRSRNEWFVKRLASVIDSFNRLRKYCWLFVLFPLSRFLSSCGTQKLSSKLMSKSRIVIISRLTVGRSRYC